MKNDENETFRGCSLFSWVEKQLKMHAQRNRTINKMIGVLFNKVYSETPPISIFFDEVSRVFVCFVLTLATVLQLFDLLFFSWLFS